jgi:uncharacterized protein (TIGR02186 family)
MRIPFFLLFVFVLAPRLANAGDIAIALTDDRVEIDADFSGAKLTLFGAVESVDAATDTLDLIAVITGPDGDYEVRALEQRGLIWMPGDPHLIENAPRFYASSSTRPVADIAPLPDQARYQLGIDKIAAVDLLADEDAAHPYNAALLETLELEGQYRETVGEISFIKGPLFTINAELPPNTPVGDYAVSVFLYQSGVLIAQDNADLRVNRVGLERRIYDLAHTRPILYGLLCVAVSLLAGWIAGVAFRKS